MFIVCGVVIDCIVGLDGGVDDYFIKLFNFDELFVWLCVLLWCGFILCLLMLEVGDLCLDLSEY